MKITLNELIEVNKRLGGHLVSDSSLKFAESACENARSTYQVAAIWIRAIVNDHPFSDANKRTAGYVIEHLIGIKNQKKMGDALTRIASKSITNLDKIKDMIKNANR